MGRSAVIDRVVVHVTQGSYAGTISWFQNPASQVSAHYVVRSSDGAVTQMVREKDIGWHAGNWTINTQSIGIEHEGFVQQDGWYTEAMYQSSAAIVRSVTAKYNIPRDRAHIIAHSEVPGATPYISVNGAAAFANLFGVPEPQSYLLVVGAAVGLGATRRRQTTACR